MIIYFGIDYSDILEEFNMLNSQVDLSIYNEKDFMNESEKFTKFKIIEPMKPKEVEDYILPNNHEKPLEPEKINNYIFSYDHDNIKYLSYSKKWDTEKLEDLANEFSLNTFGEELRYITHIILYPDDNGKTSYEFEQQNDIFYIPIKIYNLIPAQSKIAYRDKSKVLTLYDVDSITKIDDMAFAIAYAYGEYFVDFHMDVRGNISDKLTEYFSLRSKGFEDKIILEHDGEQDIANQSIWYLKEIAAWDYIYFLGSDATKRVLTFYNHEEKVDFYMNKTNISIDEYYHPNIQSRNATPHINTVIPMPQQVIGLPEYFYSFANQDVKKYTHFINIGELYISYEGQRHPYACFTIKIPIEDATAIHTALIYDENDNLLYAMKSVEGEEEMEIVWGGAWTIYWPGYNAIHAMNLLRPVKNTVYRFKVSTTYPDGSVVFSDYVDLKFNSAGWYIRRKENEWTKFKKD